MNSVNRLLKLASRFELKINKEAQEIQTSQAGGTTELFFGSDIKQKAFAAAIQDPNGPVYKFLAGVFSKTQATVSFDLKATANGGQGASWNLTVQPPSIKPNLSRVLDSVFQQTVGGSMMVKQKSADAACKSNTGAGTGTQDVGALELS